MTRRFCKTKQSDEEAKFCSSCGEKFRARRIGVGSLVETIGDDFFGFEKGFWF